MTVRKGLVKMGLMMGVLLTGVTAQGARKGAPRSPIMFKSGDSVLWVAGEEMNLDWESDSAYSTIDLDESSDGKSWKLSKGRVPSVTKMGRLKWKPSETATGTRRLRFRRSGEQRTLGELKVRLLPKAGSPETGPFLEHRPFWDRALFDFDGRERGRRVRGADLRQSFFRLQKGKGSEESLPKLEEVVRSAIDSVHLYAYNNILPVLIGRAHFHFTGRDRSQAERREFFAAGFPVDSVATNEVIFMVRNNYHRNNEGDKVVEVRLQAEGTAIRLKPGESAPYAFSKPGVHQVTITVLYSSGASRENLAEIRVKAMADLELGRMNAALASEARPMLEDPAIRARIIEPFKTK